MPNFINSNGNWSHNVNKAGTININTQGRYVDKDIVINIPQGNATLTSSVDTNNTLIFETTNNSGLTIAAQGKTSSFQAGYIEQIDNQIASYQYLKTINFNKPSTSNSTYHFLIVDCQDTNWLWKTDSEGNVWIEGTD